MKKKPISKVVMIVSGVMFALASPMLLFASYLRIQISPQTVTEAKAIEWIYSPVFNTVVIMPALAVLLLIFSVSTVISMSEKFNSKNLKSFKSLILFLLGICGIFASVTVSLRDILFDYYFEFNIMFYFIAISCFAITWIAVGVLSGLQTSWKGHLINALKGMAVGLGILFFRYLSIAAEKMSEASYYVYHGVPYEANPYYLKVVFIMAFLENLFIIGWVASMAMAFSFREASLKSKTTWMSIPLALVTGLFIFAGIIYLDNREALIELRKPLAINTGISLEKQPPREMVLLINSSGKTIEWPSEFFITNPFKTELDSEYGGESYALEPYPATPDNLKKLSEYIGRSKGGIVLSYYELALMKGYQALWDQVSVQETIVRYYRDFVLLRAQALGIFYSMPITQENKALLIRIEEEADWNKDVITSRDFCKMHKFMDMEEKGEKWCAIVRESMNWEPETNIGFANGTISGNITMDGFPVPKAKIVLLYAYENIDTIWKKYSDSSKLFKSLTFPKLIATVKPGPRGEFEFTGLKDLGDQGYELTVVFNSPMPYKIDGIDNPPGLINITSDRNTFDLGTINIRTSQN